MQIKMLYISKYMPVVNHLVWFQLTVMKYMHVYGSLIVLVCRMFCYFLVLLSHQNIYCWF